MEFKMLKSVFLSIVGALLYFLGVYISGWKFHRCDIAALIYLIGIVCTVVCGSLGWLWHSESK